MSSKGTLLAHLKASRDAAGRAAHLKSCRSVNLTMAPLQEDQDHAMPTPRDSDSYSKLTQIAYLKVSFKNSKQVQGSK
jgi:hypothetical protein